MSAVKPGKEAKPHKPTHLHDISEILPHLFVSGYGCITEAKLKQYGITHVVDATNLGLIGRKLKSFEVLEVPVADDVLARLYQHFDSVNQFVDQAKQQVGEIKNNKN